MNDFSFLISEYTALSNMPVDKSTVLADGWVKDEFEPTPIMSTYLLAFVVAEFRARERATNGLTVPETFLLQTEIDHFFVESI